MTKPTGFKVFIVAGAAAMLAALGYSVLSHGTPLPAVDPPPLKVDVPPPPPPPPPLPPKGKPARTACTLAAPPSAEFFIAEEGDSGRMIVGVCGGVEGGVACGAPAACISFPGRPRDFSTEEYAANPENRFLSARESPLSTFAADVDTASYANVRRFLETNRLPPPDAVRVEEMVNYFDYAYPAPAGEHPLEVTADLVPCPWKAGHQLARIGVQGKTCLRGDLPPSNLVFLLDVSGSMGEPNKLPLLKSCFRLLADRLDARDQVAIVTYADSVETVLEPTSGTDKPAIQSAIARLQADGCTAGGAGIQLAYQLAEEHAIPGGNNRVVLATDGDFNIGVSDTGSLVRLVEEHRKKGTSLTVLGFGMGNYKDSRLEQLADRGNGSFHYLDSILEGKKVFVSDLLGTLFTIAGDVKIQVEFNPARVAAYRLLGYENRLLNQEDFRDDRKDAGEIGCNHRVTALYEIVPVGSNDPVPAVDDLKYQQASLAPSALASGEWLTVKLRYKLPGEEQSRLMVKPVGADSGPESPETGWAAAVAEFAMLLRDSEFKGDASFDQVLELARRNRGDDPFGYRAEFIKLVETARLLRPDPD